MTTVDAGQIAGPSGSSMSPQLPLQLRSSPQPTETAPPPLPSKDEDRHTTPSPVPHLSPGEPPFQPSLTSPPLAKSTPRCSRTLQDVSIGPTPERSRTFRDVSVGMTPPKTTRKLCDASIGPMTPEASPSAVSQEVNNCGMDPEPYSDWLPSSIDWTTQDSPPQRPSHPEPLLSSPRPRTAIHIYAGAFPSPATAIDNGYYREGIAIIFVEDPNAATTKKKKGEDHWMVKSDCILAAWMNNMKQFFPELVFREQKGQYTYWEWVSH